MLYLYVLSATLPGQTLWTSEEPLALYQHDSPLAQSQGCRDQVAIMPGTLPSPIITDWQGQAKLIRLVSLAPCLAHDIFLRLSARLVT